jgi:hypothetical protein
MVPLALALLAPAAPPAVEHAVVFHDPAVFAGWPANGGAWDWATGREFAVAFVTGKFEPRKGHNVVPPYTNRLARSADGGKTWAVEDPPGFYQPGRPVAVLGRPIDFDAPNLALRVVAEGYQGGAGADGPAVNVSTDRGKTWAGPYALPRLIPDDKAGGRTEITSRTDAINFGSAEGVLLMGSARFPGKSGTDRAFAARLLDGGRKAEFLGWVVPPETPNRVLMPATVGLLGPQERLFTAVRVRQTPADVNRIDGYTSRDGGRTWALAGKVGDTGAGNGNPPAVLRLADGRLCCAYGDRSRNKLFARLSRDGGATWGEEVILREGYQPDAAGEVDFGYPRLFGRRDGAVACVYYWADKDRPTNHIARTTWTPPGR